MNQCRFLLEGASLCSSPSNAQINPSTCTYIPQTPELSSVFKAMFLQEALQLLGHFSFFHTPSSSFLVLGRVLSQSTLTVRLLPPLLERKLPEGRSQPFSCAVRLSSPRTQHSAWHSGLLTQTSFLVAQWATVSTPRGPNSQWTCGDGGSSKVWKIPDSQGPGEAPLRITGSCPYSAS